MKSFRLNFRGSYHSNMLGALVAGAGGFIVILLVYRDVGFSLKVITASMTLMALVALPLSLFTSLFYATKVNSGHICFWGLHGLRLKLKWSDIKSASVTTKCGLPWCRCECLNGKHYRIPLWHADENAFENWLAESLHSEHPVNVALKSSAYIQLKT